MAQQQWDNQSSPVYAEATSLARDLAKRGIQVKCFRRSIEEHLFKEQKGAAWFETNGGTFEVWFFPDAKAATIAVAKGRRGQLRFHCHLDRASSSSSIKT